MSGSDKTPASSDSVPEISYEAARTELSEVVRRLEAGGQSLEESLELWQRGEDLAAICQRWLDSASARLDEAIEARDSGEE
ncbi:exodeoxyribonuclease VII small subunit [Jatrophihabitans sp. GAS493]|uniref:exodeoxyribonuclease VII small subunit n=1 Tax=Jatrophihabitans sp. GAS493 TaxID=1907575 RepID=UPI000BB96C81|nr:exodeoxyribonuclease VII small subunit [Jatrophihabitans sp. GAS493]SOD75142.1 exodeoxyribonuclease VII small subunit [Jatrophihabitans sp. GAS493]